MLIQYVPENEVFKRAFQLVKKSKKTLHLTMLMKEEVKLTNKKYIKLLKIKISKGIVVRRIGFGTKIEFLKAIQQLEIKEIPSNFKFTHCPNTLLAHRMLISDKKEMLFAIYLINKKLIFYTKHKKIITNYLNFFKEVLGLIDQNIP